ncbi:Kelch repeat-containing protein [[Eubacterium] cellulosolvens]
MIFVCSGLFIFLPLNPETCPVVEAMSTWTQTSDKDFNINGTFNNTTVIGIGKNAELQIDLSDIDYWKKCTPNNPPDAHANQVMASIWGDDKAIIFGGTWYYYNETWEYNVSNNIWTDKTPNPKTATNNPSGRAYHEMASVFGDDKVILFGGGYTGVMNDTWEYDSSNGSWNEVSTSISPPARAEHAMSMVYGDDKIILFGGTIYMGTPRLNDTWIYDQSDRTWTKKSPTTWPSPRTSHAMAPIYGHDKVLLFGGQRSATGHDTWIYDLSDDSWTPATNKPTPRYQHTLASIYGEDKVLLFGGMDRQNYFDDTWVYDLSDNAWTQVIPRNSSNKPTPRAYSGIATIYQTDQVVLFGGYGGTTGSRDTWIFQYTLPNKNGTYISSPYDTCSRSSFKEISWYGNVPADSLIKFQLRTATNESNLMNVTFIGPDGSAATFYTSSSSEIWSGHNGDRWIQYKVYFNMSIFTESLSLKDVTITYNCLPETIVVDPIDESIISNNKPIFKWTFSDFDSMKQKAFQVVIDDDINFTSIDFDSGEQISVEQHWEFPMGTSYSVLSDGSWYWKVRTMDEDDEWTEYSSPRLLRIDVQNPTSAIVLPVNNGFYRDMPSITGIANDAMPSSGLQKIEITIKRLNDNFYWNGSTWVSFPAWLLVSGANNWTYDSRNVSWASGYRYCLQFRATDNANNIGQSDNINIFTIDMDAPKSRIEFPKDNNWLNKLNMISGDAGDTGGSTVKDVKINIQCTKDYAPQDGGAKENEYWDGTKWIAQETWLRAIGTQTWSYDSSEVLLKTGDHYNIRSQAFDLTGNIELPEPGITFMYDSIPPDAVGIFINNGEEYTGTTNIVLTLNAEDIGSGVAEMAFSIDGVLWSEWEPYYVIRSFELLTGDGKKTIYFRVKDQTGNIAEHVFDSIILDITPPQELSVIINEGAKYTNNSQVELDFSVIDSGSGLAEITYSLGRNRWQPWKNFQEIEFVDLPPGDGKKSIYFKAKDKVGNIAEPVQGSIIMDTAPPHSLSIVINDGATDTNSTIVNLKLNALDNTSGVDQFAFSTDGECWSTWDTFSNEISFNLPPNNGEKTIFFRAKDKAGNIAKPVKASIILNIPAPEQKQKTITSPAPNPFWYFVILTIIILILIIALGLVVRKYKRVEKEALLYLPGAVTVKPGALAGTLMSPAGSQISATLTQPKLTAGSTPGSVKQGTPTVQPVPVPTVAPKSIPPSPELPQLPPVITPTVVAPQTMVTSNITPTIAQAPQSQVMESKAPSKPEISHPETEDNGGLRK